MASGSGVKLVFCGTPQFAVPTLEALVNAGHEVALVISQPDRPVGRTAEVLPTPVKAAALRFRLPVMQPEKLKTNEDLRTALAAITPDAIIVVAYGRILPAWMLELARFGCINGHASLLPRWRGAAPIQWAIAAGDEVTGVTTMRLNAGLDTGPMLLKSELPIAADATAPEMFVLLAKLGAELMVETLFGIQGNRIVPEPQKEALATAAPLLTREDGRIDWRRTASATERRFRGFQPWPGAWTTLGGKKLIVHAMRVGDESLLAVPPGAVTLLEGEMLVHCGAGSTLVLKEVQMEGKKRMPARAFLSGLQLRQGELRLE